MIWFFQTQMPAGVGDTLIPFGNQLPTFEEFKAKVKIRLPPDFETTYFKPCIAALKRMSHDDWPYLAFNCEGQYMCIQGWGPKILGEQS